LALVKVAQIVMHVDYENRLYTVASNQPRPQYVALLGADDIRFTCCDYI